MQSRYRIIDLPCIMDPRGNLAVCEFERHIPFAAKRCFLVYQVPLVQVRGEHAHKECHQFLMCVRGSLKAAADDGRVRTEFFLNSPGSGLYMPPMVWGTQFDYTPDAMLVVFASHYYEASDYIRNYDEFRNLIAQQG